jgi:hypothetical protein
MPLSQVWRRVSVGQPVQAIHILRFDRLTPNSLTISCTLTLLKLAMYRPKEYQSARTGLTTKEKNRYYFNSEEHLHHVVPER